MRNNDVKIVDILWNAIGIGSYALVSLLLSIVIIRISGKDIGGIFSFGFSTLARVAFIITFFGIRPMHIVDIKYNYSFDVYRKLGIRLVISAIIFTTSYVLFRFLSGSYSEIKSILLIVLIFHGVLDGYSDYYECEYQRVNKLYMSGRSQFFRIMTFATALIIVLRLTSNLLIAEVVALFAELLMFYYLNVRLSRSIFKTIHSKFSYIDLFIQALPLFVITFLDTLVFAMSKFFIDINLGDVYSGFYNIVFMPTNAIYLLMTLFMKPVLTPLSYAYHNDKKRYKRLLFISFMVALLIAFVSIIISAILGDLYLNIIYYLTGNSYYEFSSIARSILVVLMLGGSFYTLCTPMYFALIIENKKRYILISYIISIIVALFLTYGFIKNYGLFGAAISFAISMFVVCIGISIGHLVTLGGKDGE